MQITSECFSSKNWHCELRREADGRPQRNADFSVPPCDRMRRLCARHQGLGKVGGQCWSCDPVEFAFNFEIPSFSVTVSVAFSVLAGLLESAFRLDRYATRSAICLSSIVIAGIPPSCIFLVGLCSKEGNLSPGYLSDTPTSEGARGVPWALMPWQATHPFARNSARPGEVLAAETVAPPGTTTFDGALGE